MHFIRSRYGYLTGILGLLTLLGCGSSSKNSAAVANAYASFAWDIYDIGDTNYRYPLNCDSVGASSVVVTLTDRATGLIYTQDPVSCASFGKTTYDVPEGDYTVGFDLYGDPTIYGNTSTLLDSFDAKATFSLYPGSNDFTNNSVGFITQSFVVDWGIYYQNAQTTCSSMSAQFVYLDFVVPSNSKTISSPFSCSAGGGTSYAIPLGNGAASWQLVLADSSGLAITSIAGGSVSVPANNDVDLGLQPFYFY
jgi:hypothetical protein